MFYLDMQMNHLLVKASGTCLKVMQIKGKNIKPTALGWFNKKDIGMCKLMLIHK